MKTLNIPSPEPAHAGRRAVLAARHGKFACIAPSLDTVVTTARLGLAVTGNPIDLASEGSKGPHPMAPCGGVDRELVVLVDDRRGIGVAGIAVSADITTMARAVISREERPVVPEGTTADPGRCPECNP